MAEPRALLALAVLGAYLAVGTLLAYASRKMLRGWSDREFFVAGGRLGGLLSAMTYAATTYSAFMIVGLVGLTYATGVGAFGFELAYYIATVTLLIVFAPRVWRMARERGWVSPGEALADLYGSRIVAVAASLLYLVALIPYASAQLKGIGEAFAGVASGAGIPVDPYMAGLALAVLVMVVWSLLAGLWSVAVTDAFQGLWMIAAATGLLAWLAIRLDSSGLSPLEAVSSLSSEGLTGLEGYWPLPVFLAFTVPWIFFAVTNPQVVQRLYVPRNERSVSDMIRWFAVFGLYFTVVVTLIGLLARAGAEEGILPWVDPKDRDAVTPTLMSIAHPALAAVVFTSIVAAAVSTADSILLTLASSVSRDLAAEMGERARRAAAVGAVVLVAAAMLAIAASRQGFIVSLSVLSSLLLLPLAPATIAAWAGFRAKWYWALASIAIGELVAVAAAAMVYVTEGFVPVKILLFQVAGIPLPVLVVAISSAVMAAGLAHEKLWKAPLRA